jgi:hypothetical protein
MSETATETVETEEAAGQTSAGETEATTEVEGAEHLGDKGKKALDAMKAERKAAQDEARQAKAERDALKAQIEGKEAEHKAQQEAQKVKDEALSAANTRILKAEVRAAAAGKLADPTDALLYIDLSKLDVSDDGEVDADAIKAAVEDLVKNKPYLAAQGGNRFQGGADGGTRNESRPAQLNRADVERLAREGKHAEIEKARQDGRLADVLSGKNP